MDIVIETVALTKRFGDVTALGSLDLAIRAGEVFGFLGPNGAGKTTTVRIVNGLIAPTGGKAYLMGLDVEKHGAELRRLSGVQTDTFLYDRLTALENLVYFAELYSMKKTDARTRSIELLTLFGLADQKDRPVAMFSKGMKQKLLVARSLVHGPRILFLDEPTAGLDPEASTELMDYLSAFTKDERRTIFLCSHRLEEVEQLCDRVAILDAGSVLATGTVEGLARKHSPGYSYAIKFFPGSDPALAKASDRFPALHSEGKDVWKVAFENEPDIAELVTFLAANGGRIAEVREERPSLRDIYLALMQGQR